MRTMARIDRTGRDRARTGTAGASRPIQPITIPARASAMAGGAAARRARARAAPTWPKTCVTEASLTTSPPAGTAR